MAEPRFAPYFQNFAWPWYMPEVGEYEELVNRSPLVNARVWGENADRYFADAAAMTRWIEQPSLVPFLGALPEEVGRAFRDEVVGRMIERTREADGRCFETFRRINMEAGK